jgi:hypothetical protein
MTDIRFAPRTIDEAFGCVVEELGEATAAAGKLTRYGPFSVNPLLRHDQQETNLAWLLRELGDVEQRIADFRAWLEKPDHLKPRRWVR